MSVMLPDKRRLWYQTTAKLGNLGTRHRNLRRNMLNRDIRSRRGIWGSKIGRYLPSEAASLLRSESHPRKLGPRAPSQASARCGGSGRCPRKSASHPTSGTVAFFTSKHAGGARPSGAKRLCSASWLRRALTAL